VTAKKKKMVVTIKKDGNGDLYRSKRKTLSMVDFLEKRREDPLNLRTWFATTATSDEWPNKSLAETGCLSSSLRSAARQPASQKKKSWRQNRFSCIR